MVERSHRSDVAVVVIMLDDLDVATLNVALNPPPPTTSWMTNYKVLFGTDSTTFTNNFVTFSLCCPSRATFLTGEYAYNHGVEGNGGENGGCPGSAHRCRCERLRPPAPRRWRLRTEDLGFHRLPGLLFGRGRQAATRDGQLPAHNNQ
jgi:hypothetical protein